MKTLKATLAQHMDWQDISTKTLAEQLGVPAPRVSEWRSGTRVPATDNAMKIADALGVTVYEVAWGETEPIEQDYDGMVLAYVPVALPRALAVEWMAMNAEQRGRWLQQRLGAK